MTTPETPMGGRETRGGRRSDQPQGRKQRWKKELNSHGDHEEPRTALADKQDHKNNPTANEGAGG